MNTKIISIINLISLIVFGNISFAGVLGEIIWFHSSAPFERKNQEVHLEWNTKGGAVTNILIKCDRSKIQLFNPAQGGQIYNCGDLLQYTTEEGIYALVLLPRNNKAWTEVKFEMELVDNENFVHDTESLVVGFRPTKYIFDQNLYFGMKNNEGVLALQKALTDLKLYNGPINGNFFNLTAMAVKQFQKKNGIKNTGFVGSLTRGLLNL